MTEQANRFRHKDTEQINCRRVPCIPGRSKVPNPMKQPRETAVELVKVSKVYPPDVVALKDVSLAVEAGSMLFLTGMSGAGKTTLLKLVCGMELPLKGMIEVLGRDLARLKPGEVPALRRQIGMAYQDFKLLPDRTVAQNIGMAMEVTYANHRQIQERVTELLGRLRLEHKHETLAGRLSRGEQQRVAIARAVANRPRLILADEPTGNLDATTTGLVMKLLEECNVRGTTILIATHDETIIRDSPHKVLELHHGRFL